MDTIVLLSCNVVGIFSEILILRRGTTTIHIFSDRFNSNGRISLRKKGNSTTQMIWSRPISSVIPGWIYFNIRNDKVVIKRTYVNLLVHVIPGRSARLLNAYTYLQHNDIGICVIILRNNNGIIRRPIMSNLYNTSAKTDRTELCYSIQTVWITDRKVFMMHT